MESRNYITKEQVRELEHYKEMFNSTSEQIEKLCSEEKSDVEYGFEMGRIYANMRSQYLHMYSLMSTIKNQTLWDEK